MPCYNIQLRTETHVLETRQIDRDDLIELRVEVARFVGELLKDHAEQVWADEDWRVDATDDSGLILFVMHPEDLPIAEGHHFPKERVRWNFGRSNLTPRA